MTEIIERSLSADRSATREAALKRSVCRYADRDIWTRLMNDTGMFTLMSEAQRRNGTRSYTATIAPKFHWTT
jgi:hypothetical protein